MTPFECYLEYNSIKRHFNSNYDYEKYNGKLKGGKTAFEDRPDKYFFTKLAKKKEPIEFLLSNFISKDYWIGDLCNNEECEKNYISWKKRTSAIEYTFTDELNKLPGDFNSWFEVNSNHPLLMRLHLSGEISLETLIIILHSTPGALEYWNKKLSSDIIWTPLNRKISKYTTFFKFDHHKMKRILLSKV